MGASFSEVKRLLLLCWFVGLTIAKSAILKSDVPHNSPVLKVDKTKKMHLSILIQQFTLIKFKAEF